MNTTDIALNELQLIAQYGRHQESIQNATGKGGYNTPLTPAGINKARENVSPLLSMQPNLIISGNLTRHEQSLDAIVKHVGGNVEVVEDERLNALFGGKIIDQDPKETEMQYQLEQYMNDSRFDAKKMKVFPFDNFYSSIYMDKAIREIVFPDETSLTSFEEIRERIVGFQNYLIEKANKKPTKALIISSCSPAAFNLEYAAFGTIGQNIYTPFGSEHKELFPMDHDEIMILGWRTGDDKLHAIEGNVKLKNYLRDQGG